MDAGLLTETQLRSALAEQRKWGGKLGHTLVQMGFVDESSMVHALSRQLHIPAVELDSLTPPEHVLKLFRVDLAERYTVFPIAADTTHKTLTLASADPSNVDALQELTFHTDQKIQVVVSSASAIERAIRKHYYGGISNHTAGMENFGIREPVYDLAPPPPQRMTSAREADLQQRIEALTQQVADLQQMVANQARSLSALIEVLDTRGAVSREEYFAVLRGAPRS
ncbi:GspE/PulE/PilB domain-containing protein [Hyalangium versicolor]|uniref:GspE/PulE/PilB domain-containing protein n=1 Tax=Hyalangium versicolor TaxID=2861190 RepID=UPI001CCF9ED4|nr:general secretion pathway protein GspE [Hyalangium versicolor]